MAASTKDTWLVPGGGIDLAQSLFCGQTFSWRALDDGAYAGVAGPHQAQVRQQGDMLCFSHPGGRALRDTEKAFWRHYFALDMDYTALQQRFGQDERLAECVAAAPGVRVLRQPFFDTLLSFILSQNNHLPRIYGIVQRLREGFGQKLAGGEYTFPTPQRLAAATLEELQPLRAGFRAKYLLDAAHKVAAGVVTEENLAALGDDAARRKLREIHGVGPKVADCVLLFALQREGVMPMDVWMKRAMALRFPEGLPACAAGSEGIAQQYLFCWARQHLPRGGAS